MDLDESIQANSDEKPKYRSNNYQYEEQTAVSEGTNRQYDSSDYQYESRYQPQNFQPPKVRPRSPEDVAKNDELLSLLIGERVETNEQKRERQRQYREALEQQKVSILFDNCKHPLVSNFYVYG